MTFTSISKIFYNLDKSNHSEGDIIILKKFNKHIPKKVYKILGQVKGTGISTNKQTAYKRAKFLMGMNAEAMNADVVLHTHYSPVTTLNNMYHITYSGTAIKITNQEFLNKLQNKTN